MGLKGTIWRLVIGLGSALLVVAIFTSLDGKQGEARSEAEKRQAWRSEEEERTISVYRQVNEAVVFITTVTLTVDPFDWFAGIRPQEGSGSGIIVDAKRGIILTNLHVIQNAHKIEIILSDGRPHQAALLGYDQEYDIAVLRLNTPPKNLVSLRFGDSSRVEVGQRVLAIGNPFGLNRTLTTGIISSIDRTVNTPGGTLMRGLLQTDAAVNPGNSGGPLLDLNGDLIGINTATLSRTGDSAGIGFAVPVNPLKKILPELIATGRVLRPSMGWVLVDTNQGPIVRRVVRGGPAHKAGIQPIERVVGDVFLRGYSLDLDRADLIYMVNGKRVNLRDEVDQLIEENGFEQPLQLTLRVGGRADRERTIEVEPVPK